MDTALIVATFFVASLTLVVALYEVRLLRGRFRREDEAELGVEDANLYELENAPAGWQVIVTVRNTGGATAFNQEVWIGESPDPEEVRRLAVRNREQVAPGQSDRIARDLPVPADGTLALWLTWDDSRGPQVRDSGRRL